MNEDEPNNLHETGRGGRREPDIPRDMAPFSDQCSRSSPSSTMAHEIRTREVISGSQKLGRSASDVLPSYTNQPWQAP